MDGMRGVGGFYLAREGIKRCCLDNVCFTGFISRFKVGIER